jgi:t-SNARE complex subunit (syntaxin)
MYCCHFAVNVPSRDSTRIARPAAPARRRRHAVDDIHIKERQACSECGRRLLNIINGLCFTCTAEALARLRESSIRLAEQYQTIIMEQNRTQAENERLLKAINHYREQGSGN